MTDAEGNEIGKLFVGGLSQATNNGSLRLYFSRFGEVDDAVVMMDNKTGRSRGFGYVKFHESESVTLALEAKPHILDGKEVDAKQCNVNMKGRNRRSLKIFVGGIGLDQDVESIKNYFKQFGRVTDVNLMMDSNKQRHRGFAFVGFEDEAVVKRLIGLHYVTMNNKQVEIKAMEPPNFGRKISSVPCVTPGGNGLGGNPTGDSTCAHSYEVGSDSGAIIPGNFNGLNSAVAYGSHHPYLSPQTSALSCAQHNLLGQPRTNPSLTYEHQHHPGYGGTMISDGLYPSATYLQPVSPTQHAVRNPAESILSPGAAATSFGTAKPSVPFILSNGQMHQSSSLVGFPPSTTSVYAPFPCSFVPPSTFVPAHHTTAGNVGALISADKAALGGWSASSLHAATHLAICPSQIGAQPSLLSCSQFSPSVAQHIGTTNSAIQPGSTAPNASDTGSMLTPYYTVCPQYTAIQLQPDQTSSAPHFPLGSSNPTGSSLIGNTVTSCGLSAGQSGGLDVGILALSGTATSTNVATNSRPNSSNGTEVKLDTDASASHTAVNKPPTYPATTIIMPTPNASGYPSGAVLPSASSALNLGQAMWNHSPTNLLYSSIPVGWGVSSTGQSGQGQSWHSGVAMVSQKIPVTQNSTTPSLKLSNSTFSAGGRSMHSLSSESVCPAKESSIESANVASAKASGDSLDGSTSSTAPTGTTVATTTNNEQHIAQYTRSELNMDTSYRCGKPQTASSVLTKDANGSGDEVSEQLNTWQITTNEPTSALNAGSSAALPSWNRGAISSTVNGTRWTGMTNNGVNYPITNNMMIHPHSWNLPLEMMDENLTGYDDSVTKSNTFGVRRPNHSTLSGLNRNVVTQTTNYSNVLNKTSSMDAEKNDDTSTSVLSGPYSRLSQRITSYSDSSSNSANRTQTTESHSPVQGHSKVSRSNEPAPVTMEDTTNSSVNMVSNGSTATGNCSSGPSTDLGTSRGGNTRLDYGSWLYANNTTNTPLETSTSGDGKELATQSAVGVELECQGPAGAAGDFHRPVHTGHFSGYRVSH
ncbi:Heterogeneous nuclear ribonucleoprotein 27C [Fasciola hepatica]|uniref:Heterogeneous nuclear ribonucleoprotein 27C n=1 Tax=Fasciola hepatica TaxID=6192 RepID=A0A2H1CN11_FASHE|nr:Heterogeneous nuclear ribonucleoprotein 27C [Fasciola hepatica]